MSRQESDREDLIREAVAFTERMELRIESLGDVVTAGFRPDGSLSLYFGQNPVYGFDPLGRLRRAWEDGFLYRSEPPTLARLQRVRTVQRTILQQTHLDSAALSEFHGRMLDGVQLLSAALKEQTSTVLRAVPETTDLRPKIAEMLSHIQSADPWLSDTIRARR
jgi:hypothetical protein